MSRTFADGEDALVAALRRDPDEGLAVLHEPFGRWILRYLNRVTQGHLGAMNLDDAYQETLLVLLGMFRQPGFQAENPFPLICGVARRKALKAVQRNRHARLCARALSEHPGDRADAFGPQGEDAELLSLVRALVERLPPRQRLVARLVVDHCQEWQPRKIYSVVAEAMQTSTGRAENPVAVKSAWHAARATLAAKLHAHGYPVTDPGRPR
jgi:DNA-directed RNA polymerase specialized sigma24 family protein